MTTETLSSAQSRSSLAPLSGVVAVVLFVIGFIIFEVVGDTPDGDETAQQYLDYFRDEDGTIWIGAWIFLVGIVFFLWFLGTLRAALDRAEGGGGALARTAYAGGVGTALLVSASLGTQISGAIAADENDALDPAVAQTFWWAADGLSVAATFFLAALYAATAVLAWRTRLLPRWFAVVTAIFAVASAIPFVGWGALFFALPLWIVFVALWLSLRRAPAATP